MKNVNVIQMVPTLLREVIEGIRKEREKVDGYKDIQKVFVGGRVGALGITDGDERSLYRSANMKCIYGPTEGTMNLQRR